MWGNFPDYQTGARFARCFDPARADAERFQRDVQRSPFGRLGGRRILALLSAMIVAAHAAGYRHPFPRGCWAWAFHGWVHEQMFPGASVPERLYRLATGRASRRYGPRKMPVEISSEAALP